MDAPLPAAIPAAGACAAAIWPAYAPTHNNFKKNT